jgi:hypothetical protein
MHWVPQGTLFRLSWALTMTNLAVISHVTGCFPTNGSNPREQFPKPKPIRSSRKSINLPQHTCLPEGLLSVEHEFLPLAERGSQNVQPRAPFANGPINDPGLFGE